ncbi:MAG TPA: sigma-70 family RNA polymerase sigma factor [Caldilineaceae bacterium]|nr:sigma-70 family RNA polymerase sigma factor [Caldilineaceae bacterium]
MEELSTLIAKATAARAARAAQHHAFDEIVRRFQDMAFACAYAVLGDFHLAEDAAQDAFIVAWRNLDQLRKPEAFPGWLKRIVLTQCNRLTRGKRVQLVSLDAILEAPAADADPYMAYEQKERQIQVYAAIQALPEAERLATALFYISDYSQNDIAAFLEAPVTTVKKRLFSARRKLRERMVDMVRESLQEKRPSRNETFVDTVALFNAALESFVNKVRQDRYIIAAILYGSLSHDTVWRKSDIDILLIGREEKPVKDLYLVENGVNIHAVLMPRSKFKQALEGSLQGSLMHSTFALSTLLFTSDATIREYYQNVQSMGAFDREMRLLRAGSSALYTLAKAEKWLYTRKDISYSFLWIMYTIQHLATIEVVLHGEVTSREVILQALKINPAFFNKVYYDLIHQKKDEAVIQQALALINGYIDEKIPLLFGPVLAYLAEAGGIRTTSEIDEYFRKQAQVDTLSGIYEWLADKGIIQKAPSPLRLTHKSQVTVDEAAYYYDGNLDWRGG